MAESIYLTAEHEALRDQVQRFVAKEVEPFGEAWEESGCVPREVLRKMGSLGFFGITYPDTYGGAGADALTNLVFAEALSQSTFGGFVVTVLVHTDMASPHLVHAGIERADCERYLPPRHRGELITAVARHRARRGLGRGAACAPRAARRRYLRCSTARKMFITNGVHADLYFIAARKTAGHSADAKGSRGISMFIVEKGTPGFRVGRALKKSAGCAPIRPNSCSRIAASRRQNLLGEEHRGFYALMSNFQNERMRCRRDGVGDAHPGDRD